MLWGDTHLHTTNSLDASTFGVTLDVEDAYRFACGETVISTSGQPAKLSRPLDFLVVTDHSDAMGVVAEVVQGQWFDERAQRTIRQVLVGSEIDSRNRSCSIRLQRDVAFGDYPAKTSD